MIGKRRGQTDFYCIFVMGGREELFKAEAQELFSRLSLDGTFYFFTHEVWVGKARKGIKTTVPFFPGYVFLASDSLELETVEELRKLTGFIRFLYDNTNIVKLDSSDLRILEILMMHGENQPMSGAEYTVDDRVRIISGSLKDFTGFVTKYDRRRQKVSVQINTSNLKCTLELSYDVVEKIPEN